MELKEALKLLNSKFKYKSDPRYFDVWRILTGDKAWEGDCEDYSLTLIWLLSDRNIFKFLWNITTFKYLIWFVKLNNGSGHVVLKIDNLYYDNIQKKGVTKEVLTKQGYKLLFPMIFPFVYIKLLLSYTIGFLFK